MRYRFFALLLVFGCLARVSEAQKDAFAKNFNKFANVVTNIDFYASKASDVAPFEKPVREARERLSTFLGKDLSRGAIVICSSLEQRDSVNEGRILRMDYKWVLVPLTAEAASQQMFARLRAQMGDQIPPGLLERFQNQSPEMKAAADARMVSTTLQNVSYATLSTTLAPDKEFRPARLEDMGRSPLDDWLDIGLASYAAGVRSINFRFLQDHLEEVFPLEDLLYMPRPFVAPSEGGGGGGGQGGMRIFTGGGSPGGAGGAPAVAAAPPNSQAGVGNRGGQPQGGGNRGGGSGGGMGGGGRGGQMPKDVQDRMTFDAQAAAFFAFALEKVGIDKMREVVQWNRDGKQSRDALVRSGYLGTDLDKIEAEWEAWAKNQKGEAPPAFRITTEQAKPTGPPH